jgi:WD40 repeat protein/tRNA A-37 threonylcarbamoyl transferase component Bud32
MSIDERLVELLLEAEEWRRQGRAVTVKDLCPDDSGLWPALEALLLGLGRVDRLLVGPDRGGSTEVIDSPGPEAAPPRIPGYEILREIGRGGMGIVYEARETAMSRQVAVKVLQHHGDPARFRREARAAGRLHHTNIVPVFGIGEHAGRPYYVMQVIDGRGLDDLLRRGAPGRAEGAGTRSFDGREVARIGMQVAAALAYAHDQGVVHRDIKPSNLLVEGSGMVWVTDFGLAKAGDDQLTHTGDLLGTIRYMAPERFRGEADARTDVYALGLTLYELLTLRPAFDSPDRLTLIEQIKGDDPPRPRSLDPRIPRDLETAVLKAIEKDPKARYQTAGALGEDLRRFLADEPVKARRVGVAERCLRWARRNPMVAALGASLTALLVSVAAGALVVADSFKESAWRESLANRRSQIDRRAAEVARTEAVRERDSSRRQSAGLLLDRGLALAEQGEAARGLFWMLEGLRVAPAEDEDFRRVIRANLWAWGERVHCLRRIIPLPVLARCATFSPDGKTLVIGTGAFRLVPGRMLGFWDASTFERIGTPWLLSDIPMAVAFSPDGMTLVTGGASNDPQRRWGERGEMQRWDVGRGVPLGAPLAFPRPVTGVAFSPDGALILTVTPGDDRAVQLWDAASGRLHSEPRSGTGTARSAALGPDGRVLLVGLATSDGGGALELWDLAGQALGKPWGYEAPVTAAAFSPDGRTLLGGDESGTARLWDRATDKPRGVPMRQDSGIGLAAFTPDGSAVVIRSGDAFTASVWDAATGVRLGTPLWHSGRLECLAVRPDALAVLTGGADQTARLWELGRSPSRPADPNPDQKSRNARGSPAEPRLPNFLLNSVVDYSADRTAVVMTDGGSLARLFETATGRPLGVPMRHPRNARAVAFSPDGRVVATASHNTTSLAGTVHLWDAATGRPRVPPIRRANLASALAFSPDGRVLATGDYDRLVQRWDVATGQPLGAPLVQGGIVFSIAFSPDGRTLAVGTVESADEARLWDVATGRPLGRAMPHANWVVAVAFSPDGRTLLTRSHDRTIRLWNAATGEPLTDYLPHQALSAAAFSPDGRLVATGGRDSRARLWDAKAGRPLPGATMTNPSPVSALAFSPDGKTLGIGGEDGSARLWDLATLKPLGPPLVQRYKIIGAAFTPDGRRFLTTAADGATRSWPVPEPLGGDPDRIALHLQVRTALQMDAGQAVAPLAPEDWEERRRRLVALEGSVEGAYASSVSEAAYHEARARDAEQDGNTFAVIWHLDRLIAARPDDWTLYVRRGRARLSSDAPAEAAADLDRAGRLGPRQQVLDWQAHAAAEAVAAGRWATALWYLDRLIAARPDDGTHFGDRAGVFVGLGRPAEAQADRDRAEALALDNEFPSYPFAP